MQPAKNNILMNEPRVVGDIILLLHFGGDAVDSVNNFNGNTSRAVAALM